MVQYGTVSKILKQNLYSDGDSASSEIKFAAILGAELRREQRRYSTVVLPEIDVLKYEYIEIS